MMPHLSSTSTASGAALMSTAVGPVHVDDLGGEGPLHVLVHGLEGSHRDWTSFGAQLSERGRVVAVDLVGFGGTPPAGRRSDLRTNRDLLAAVIDEFGTPATVIGTSMGGLLAMMLAESRPDMVERLVLVAPGQPKHEGVSVDWRLSAVFLAITLPGVGEAAMWARDRFEGQRAPWGGAAFLQAARSMVRELRRHEGFTAFVRDLPQSALIVQGGADPLVNPNASKALAALRDDWDLVMMEGLGHAPHVEAPDRMADVVKGWLGAR